MPLPQSPHPRSLGCWRAQGLKELAVVGLSVGPYLLDGGASRADFALGSCADSVWLGLADHGETLLQVTYQEGVRVLSNLTQMVN